MKLPNDTFVVGICQEGMIRRFYGIDHASGGYPYFQSDINSAQVFHDEATASSVADLLGKKVEIPNASPSLDGFTYPHPDIRRALALTSSSNMSGSGEAVVLKIVFEAVKSVPIKGEIQAPAGHVHF